MRKQTVQTTISYRVGKITSGVSMQPATFEGITEYFGGSKKEARIFIKTIALEGRDLNANDLSLYVQSQVLIHMMPENIRSRINIDILAKGRKSIRYTNVVDNVATKLSTLPILHEILNILFDGASEQIHKKFAMEIHKAKKLQKEAGGDSYKKNCNLSHLVRERIITNLIAAVENEAINNRSLPPPSLLDKEEEKQ